MNISRAALLLVNGLLASLALAQQDEILWIDVRSAAEYQAGHVAGHVNIPHTEIVEGVAGLTDDKTVTIRLYCASGGRAGKAQQELAADGYSDVINLGGYRQVTGLLQAQTVN